MNFVLSVEHPAWAHQFRYIIQLLEQRGHRVLVLAIKKDVDLELLKQFGIPYVLVGTTTGSGILQKAWLLFSITLKMIWACRHYKPDCFIGRASPMMAMTAACYRRPHVIFEDTEHSHISLFFCRHLSTRIITPVSFRTNLGKAQKRLPVYKESFYLHPAHFKPDPAYLHAIGIQEGEPFVLMRFVAWTADHDLGQKGLSLQTKIKAVKAFEQFGRVLISSEEQLPAALEPYRIRIAPEKIHHIMYYASLLYGESATMASECAVLGTHAIYCDFTGRGYTDEQEKKYGLVYNFRLDPASQEASVQKGMQLLQNPNLWKEGKNKREKLLQEVRDGSSLFLEELAEVENL
ncbi:MAG: hypothetical protein KatS3mg031_1136 [Chitinophagales bacterium]|nr:MAG: hypothetical protein KatS3mg031_1136 [Chitinophagales bacterium]